MATELKKIKGYSGLAMSVILDGKVFVVVADNDSDLEYLWKRIGLNQALNHDKLKLAVVVPAKPLGIQCNA